MTRNRAALAVLGTLFVLALAPASWAAPVPASVLASTRKIDARLLSQSFGAPGQGIPVWVSFADKGERSPADLAARLVEAERSLSPRARARRVKAGVTPLVD